MTDVVENANWGSASTRSSMSLFPCGRAPRTPQNGGGGSCFGDHYDSHHKMAEWPRYTDVDYFTGNDILVDDEI